jgi:alanyl-tRNA synthetase
VKALLKNPKDLSKAIKDLQDKNSALTKEIEGFEKLKAQGVKQALKSKITDFNGMNFLGEIVELDGGGIKDILFQLKGEFDNLVAVIGGKADGKCTLSIIVSEELSKANDIHAGNLIREASKFIQGGGGGQPFFATAGGTKPEGLQEAIDWVKTKL